MEEYTAATGEDYEPDMKDVMCADAPRKFHDMIYYTIVTFSTVGFGDIAP